MNRFNIKEIVKEKYSRIAKKEQDSCCGASNSCCDNDYTVFSESYDKLEGYLAGADLGLGCGLPTEFAGLKNGDHVLDLGSGAGNDCFVARTYVGESGKVTGLDFSEAMIEKARKNASKLNYSNIEFVKGDIEEMPLPDNTFDVILSNCVLNLVPDKEKAFKEMLRVLKPDGHFCISDVVVNGQLPEKLRNDAEMYAGCVAGALQTEAYLDTISSAGFRNIVIHKERKIEIPETVVRQYLSDDEYVDYQNNHKGLLSLTISALK